MFNKLNINKIGDWIIRLIFTILFFTFIWGIYSYSNYLGIFNIKTINISGNSIVSKEEILNQLYLLENESSISIDISNQQEQVNVLDYVYSSQIYREFPSTIHVSIKERQPMLTMKFSDTTLVMDRTGMLLPFVEQFENNLFLPKTFYKKSFYTIKDNHVEIKSLYNTLNNVISSYSDLYFNISKVSSINNGMQFITFDDTNIYIKSEDIEMQMIILKNLEKTLGEHALISDYSSVDLRIPGQVIVREK